MNRLTILLRRPATLAVLLAAMTLPTILSTGWAVTNNWCPGSPWNCLPFNYCVTYDWCNGSYSGCSPTANYQLWMKQLIIKKCTQTGFADRYCSSCQTLYQYTGNCCVTSENEPSCPNVQGCPP
jgi:hypothetical protein